MTHTPGPWSAWGTGQNWMIRGGAGQVTGNVAQTLPRPEFGQEAANARLIAKAPEMYELLSGLLKAITKEDEHGSTPLCYNCVQVLSRSISEAHRIKTEIDGQAKHGEG